MNDVFLKLFNMSMAASWLILAVLVLRLLLKKTPGWMRCIFWAIVALRLVCPFSFESVFSLIPSAETISPEAVQYTMAPAVNTGIPAVNDVLNPVISSSFHASPGDSVNPMFVWIQIAGMIWAVGFAAMIGYAAVGYLRVRRMVAEAVRLRDNIYICDAISSPFILGVLRPRIYVSSNIEETQMNYVLAHEQAHLKRKDHWWKPFGYVLLAVYWFNPLVWISYILLCRDIELACDEKAVRDLNMTGRKAYSEALLACSMQRRLIMACPIAFGEVGVKERIKNVLHYKKPAFGVTVVTAIVCIVVMICFLTNPKENDSLEGMLNAQKEELTEEIGSIIGEAQASRYEITDWELVVNQMEGIRADCIFGANWISIRKPEEDPMIQGMYQTAQSLSDEMQRTAALETADGWLAELQSWPEEEYLEQPIVIMQEGEKLVIYYPYVMDGAETLIPLKEFAKANWTEDAEQRYQQGVAVIREAFGMDETKDADDAASAGEKDTAENGNTGDIANTSGDAGQKEAALEAYESDWTEDKIIEEIQKRQPYQEQCSFYGEVVHYMEYVREVRDISMLFEPMFATDTQYYSEEDFQNVPLLILQLAGYEIYARHGCMFQNENLQNYFMIQLWYLPAVAQDEFSDTLLNTYEKENLALIGRLEAAALDLYSGTHHYYIKGADGHSLFLDEVEWVSDEERAAELGLNEEDMPGGFYVYNEESSQVEYPFAEGCSFTILDWNNNYQVTDVDQQTFLDILSSREGIPFIIEIKDGKIVSVTEQYVP